MAKRKARAIVETPKKKEDQSETTKPVGKAPANNQTMNSEKVKMTFKEAKYYNDLDNPIFVPGKVYTLEGADWIARWIKRGGVIVEGELPTPKQDPPNNSTIVGETPKNAEGGASEGENTNEVDETSDDGQNEEEDNEDLL